MVANAIRNSSRGAQKHAQHFNQSDVKAAKENVSILRLLTWLNAPKAHDSKELWCLPCLRTYWVIFICRWWCPGASTTGSTQVKARPSLPGIQVGNGQHDVTKRVVCFPAAGCGCSGWLFVYLSLPSAHLWECCYLAAPSIFNDVHTNPSEPFKCHFIHLPPKLIFYSQPAFNGN